jgi:hypothetical protein
MKKEPSPTPQNRPSQIRAFRKAARELGCEDNEELFKEALRKIAKSKPQPHVKKEGR